jgi:hypothetical protein
LYPWPRAAILFFVLWGLCTPCQALEVTLRWKANNEANLAGYKVYYRATFDGPPYTGTGADQGNSPITIPIDTLEDSSDPRYVLSGLVDHKSYFFAVTAYNSEVPPAESSFSNKARVVVDRDNDQMPDDLEILYGLNPGDSDSDHDGMDDWYEWSRFLAPLDPNDALEDPDGDGHTNLQEYQAGTDPQGQSSNPQIAAVPTLFPHSVLLLLIILFVLGVTRIREPSHFQPATEKPSGG